MESTFDYTNANPKAHNYALDKLKEKFGKASKCTLMDYIEFYAEGLKLK